MSKDMFVGLVVVWLVATMGVLWAILEVIK